jgi:ankyrin repeat protein
VARGAPLTATAVALHSLHELSSTQRAGINATITSEGLEFTPLICATENRCCTTALEALLRSGADLCVLSSPQCVTALHVAAANGLPRSCELVLARAGTVLLERRDTDGWTALMYAARSGCVDCAQLLLQYGADVNCVDNHKATPIMLATLRKHVKVMVRLLKAGADVNAVNDSGFAL